MPVTINPAERNQLRDLPWEQPSTDRQKVVKMLRDMADELEKPHLRLNMATSKIGVDMMGPDIVRMHVDLRFDTKER